VVGNCAVGARVVLIRAKGALRDYYRIPEFFITVKEPKLREIAGAPAAQFPKSFKLA